MDQPTWFTDVGALAARLCNPARFTNDGQQNPYFRYFVDFTQKSVATWLQKLQDALHEEECQTALLNLVDPDVRVRDDYPSTDRPVRPRSRPMRGPAQAANAGTPEAAALLTELERIRALGMPTTSLRLEKVPRGTTLEAHRLPALYLVLDGVLMLYVEAQFHTGSGDSLGLKQARVNGRLRFPGDVIGEHGLFYPVTNETSFRSLRHQALKDSTLLRVPYSFLRGSHHPVSAVILDQLPRAIVTKIRRDEGLGVRLFSLEASNWYRAMLLHLLCQFGHPALLPEPEAEVELPKPLGAYTDGPVRRVAQSLVSLDLDFDQANIACLQYSKPHNPAARDELVSFAQAVGLHGEGMPPTQLIKTWEGPPPVHSFIEAALRKVNGAQEPSASEVDELIKGLQAAGRITDGRFPTLKGCLMSLPNLLPPGIFELLKNEYGLYESADWSEQRKRMRELVKAARLSFTLPRRFTRNEELLGPLEEEFRSLFAHWSQFNRKPKEPIAPPAIGSLSDPFRLFALLNGGFHVRHPREEEFLEATAALLAERRSR